MTSIATKIIPRPTMAAPEKVGPEAPNERIRLGKSLQKKAGNAFGSSLTIRQIIAKRELDD